MANECHGRRDAHLRHTRACAWAIDDGMNYNLRAPVNHRVKRYGDRMTASKAGARNQKGKVVKIDSDKRGIREERIDAAVAFLIRQTTPLPSRSNHKLKDVASAMVPNAR